MYQINFRKDLQGLRAIAIALVVLSHSGLGIMDGGFIGVDVFFVLSGYLITGLLLQELASNDRIDFLNFYARRFKRLLPALMAMLAITLIISTALLSATEAKSQLASTPFAALWGSNLFFAFQHIDYFDELSSQDLFLHTWSLGVEEQFYLIWPGLLLIVSFISSNNKKIFTAAMLIIFFSSLALSVYLTEHSPQQAFYLMPSRIWQFALGAITFLACQQYSYIAKKKAILVSSFYIALISLFTAGLLISPSMSYPGLWALIPSLATAAIIFSGFHIQPSIFNNRIIQWLGDRSYSWYLWHWPILIIGFSFGLKGEWLETLAILIFSLFIAHLSFSLIEKPFWKGSLSQAKPKKVIVICLAIIITSPLLFLTRINLITADITEVSIEKWRADIPIIYPMGCDAWYLNDNLQRCIFGNNQAKQTVFMLGDSIGAQWFSFLPIVFDKSQWRIIVHTKSACPIIDEDFYYKRIKSTYTICTTWRNKIIKEIQTINPDVLIIGNAIYSEFTDEQVEQGSKRILKQINSASRNIIIIPGTPKLSFDGPSCIKKNIDNSDIMQRCSSTQSIEKSLQNTSLLTRAAADYSNVKILNLNDLVCPNRVCTAFNKSTVIFRDSQHLTNSFVIQQSPEIKKRIESLGINL